MIDSPAIVLRSYLISQGCLSLPDTGGDWPAWISFLPDAPDDSVVLLDDDPQLDGRVMFTGGILQHWGIALQLRSLDYQAGYLKMFNMMTKLSTIVRERVTVGSATYMIQSVTNRSGVVSLGLEVGTKRRRMFVMDLLVSLTML